MKNETVQKLRMAIKGSRIRPVGITDGGWLVSQSTGHGETMDDLMRALHAADAVIERHGYTRDASAPLSICGLRCSQRLCAL